VLVCRGGLGAQKRDVWKEGGEGWREGGTESDHHHGKVARRTHIASRRLSRSRTKASSLACRNAWKEERNEGMSRRVASWFAREGREWRNHKAGRALWLSSESLADSDQDRVRVG
jgi:hypothetical protein